MKSKIQPPCYNRETKESCPNRSTFCRQSCEEWQVYEKAKMEEYQKKREDLLREGDIKSYIAGKSERRLKDEKRLVGKRCMRR